MYIIYIISHERVRFSLKVAFAAQIMDLKIEQFVPPKTSSPVPENVLQRYQ